MIERVIEINQEKQEKGLVAASMSVLTNYRSNCEGNLFTWKFNVRHDSNETITLLFIVQVFSAFESQSDFEVPHPYHSGCAEKF